MNAPVTCSILDDQHSDGMITEARKLKRRPEAEAIRSFSDKA